MRHPALPRWSLSGLAVSLFAGLPAVLLSCGDADPTGLDTSALELILVQGDLQSAEAGVELPLALQVRLQTRGSGAAVKEVEVRWKVTDGAGASLDPAVSETNSLGLAETRLTLGPDLGTYRVQATVRKMDSGPVEFSANAIVAPVLHGLLPGAVGPGDTIMVGGANFSTTPSDNIVSFSRVRGQVLSSSSTELQVVVPPCLFPREYDLRVQVGALVTGAEPLLVEGEAESPDLDVGGDLVVDPSTSSGCIYLPSSPGAHYLVVAHSTGTVSEAEYEYSLVALTQDGASPVAGGDVVSSEIVGPRPATSSSVGSGIGRTPADVNAHDRWDEVLRGLERDHLREWRARGGSVSALSAPSTGDRSPSKLPEVGDVRRFKVLNADEEFENVSARLRFVTDRALVYMDEVVPSGGFTDSDLAVLALEFDSPIHPTVTGAFGAESDLDENERVIILFTPAVNRLSDEISDGYVGGFFYGLDLLEGEKGSNDGEIFYAMVPDPMGQEGPAISRTQVLLSIPAVLAHEFEHMVHFNRRMLLGNAENSEALWLSEALAQMAEDLVASAYLEVNNRRKADEFRTGNWIRAERFLEETSQVSVLASLPPGTLAERGAGWLLIKQLSERPELAGLLEALAGSTLSGTDNLTDKVGLGWESVMADWVGSLFLDGLGLPIRDGLEMGGVNLRWDLAQPWGAYPLQAHALTGSSALVSGTLWSSAPKYFIISPPAGGAVIGAGGPMGGPLEPGLGLRLLVVRLQ